MAQRAANSVFGITAILVLASPYVKIITHEGPCSEVYKCNILQKESTSIRLMLGRGRGKLCVCIVLYSVLHMDIIVVCFEPVLNNIQASVMIVIKKTKEKAAPD